MSLKVDMKVNTRTYSLSIESYPDGYPAYFPVLEGCNIRGKTYEEAVTHAEEALALYLETLDELGKAIPQEHGLKQPVSLGVTVRIPIIA
jgi:predicted RNase H-like HicB family nuclease